MIRFVLFISLLALSSCVTHGNLLLLDEGGEFPQVPETVKNYLQPVIQANDVLYISVEGDENAIKPYTRSQTNNNNGGGNLANQNPSLLGYLVNTQGEIEYPGLGSIKVAGLTTEQIRALLVNRISAYVNDFIVNVRLLNFRITLLGEVSGQGVQTVTNERITILEALGQAGGLTSYGNAEDLLLVREVNGERTYNTINLHDKNIFNSPLFYLQPNDLIYVRPLAQKTATVANQSRNLLPWIGLVASTINLYLLVTRL